jgi:hypothetical protein
MIGEAMTVDFALALVESLTTAEIVGVVLGVIGIAGTFVALGLAFDQYRKARETINDLNKVAQELTSVKESVLTYYIGVFPDFLDNIVEMLTPRAKELIIFCDYPGYGIFSEREKFDHYIHQIRQQDVNEAKIRFTYLHRHRREKLHLEQFGVISNWEAWKQDSDNERKIKCFLDDTYGEGQTIETITEEDFNELLIGADQKVLDKHFSSAEKIEINLPMPLYFWIRDSEEAIFAIATMSGGVIEVAFHTRDHNLITALKHIFDRYTKEEQWRKEEETTCSNVMEELNELFSRYYRK